MKQTKQFIKNKFKQGNRPTEADFADWLDSFVHLDEQAVVDSQVVDQKINAFNNALLSRNQNGKADTLGDVFAMLKGLDDTEGYLKILLDKIDWTKIPNKPAQVALVWTEQAIVTDTSKFDPQPRDPALPQTTSTNPAEGWLLSQIGALVTQNIILDMKVKRQWFSNNGTPFYVDQIITLKIAVNPKAKLN